MSVAFLAAADAGRLGEGGTGALWIAPELVEGAPPAESCSQRAAVQPRELVFETLQPENFDAELPGQLALGARGVVAFEWNAGTGELSYTTSTAAGMFSDLAPSLVAYLPSGPRCESR